MRSHPPAVSFVVPCYKLAHLLGDCLESILRQTYADFEILVMDDCSPDHTREVVDAYSDRRIRYVRNEPNLGNLRNYNKGIRLARGRYLWLISADDRLRDPALLARYVRILDSSPQVSFAFCAGVEIDAQGRDTGLRGRVGPHDQIFAGDDFLRLLLDRNRICTPSVLARRELYLGVGLFPLDLPYAGDWYLWGRFAMAGSVAYVAKPSVDYRLHQAAQTHVYREKALHVMVRDEVAVRWKLLDLLRTTRRHTLAQDCLNAIVDDYADRLRPVRPSEQPELTVDEFEASVARHAAAPRDAAWVRSRTYGIAGDRFHVLGDHAAAAACYATAWRSARCSKFILKYLLCRLGRHGTRLRGLIEASRAKIGARHWRLRASSPASHL
jgi:hypothetical protein